MPLHLTSTAGKLHLTVHLQQDEPYRIGTDINQERTSISDFKLIVPKAFDIKSKNATVFEPP